MSMKFKLLLLSAGLIASTTLAGCGLSNPLSGGKEKIDPPKEVNYLQSAAELDDENTTETVAADEAAQTEKFVQTELYLFDKNGYVVPTTIALPNTESVAKQALEYLVQDGPVADLLPSGFQAVLPAETVVKSIDIQNGQATVDFSKEFGNYAKEDESKVLQSLAWTLTQFDSVNAVSLRMEGKDLTEMPVNKTSVAQALTRGMGINNEVVQVADIHNTRAMTVYFFNDDEKNSYLVPITRRVANTGKDNVTAAVNELIKGPSADSNLVSYFMEDTALVDEPVVEGGLVSLNFNQNISTETDNNLLKVDRQLLDSLVLTLTDQADIDKVSLFVNGNADLVDENGEKLVREVSRPVLVNTGSY